MTSPAQDDALVGVTSAALSDATLAATSGALTPSTTGATPPSTMGALATSTLAALAQSPSAPLSGLSTMAAGSMLSDRTPFNFSQHITVKLTNDNYLLWRSQVVPLLRSHYLMGFVDGTYPCPPDRVVRQIDGRAVAVPNPEHRAWVMQDQAILSAINTSMTPSVAGLVMFATTA